MLIFQKGINQFSDITAETSWQLLTNIWDVAKKPVILWLEDDMLYTLKTLIQDIFPFFWTFPHSVVPLEIWDVWSIFNIHHLGGPIELLNLCSSQNVEAS